MARDRANINTNIWTDDHWRTLTSDQQWLYTLILTHPTLSYAGVADWRPGRLAKSSSDKTRQDVERIAAELQAERFVLVDDDTEEILIRSFLRHDGLLKQPKLGVSMVNAYGAVASTMLREVIAHELQRLHSEHPEWNAFKVDQVLALTKAKASPMENFGQGFTPAFTLPVTPTVTPNGDHAQAVPTATATTTTTSTVVEGSGEGRRKPERPLPEDWAPNDTHKGFARTEGINLQFQFQRFTNWAKAKDARYRDWDAAFRNWLLKAEKSTTANEPSPWDRKGVHA